MAGDGLVRPVNAPQAGAAAVGIQPGGNSQIVRARQVIVSGAADGVFVYAAGTAPGLGNPPVTWESSGLADPYGNVLPSTTGVEGSGTFKAGNTTITSAGGVVVTGAFGTVTVVNGQIAFANGGVIYGAESPDTIVISGALIELPTVADVLDIIEPGSLTGASEQWHDLRPLGTGFAGTNAGFWPPQYRYNVLGDVELIGSVSLAASYNSVTWGTIAADWAPAVNSYLPVQVQSNAGAAPGNSQGQYLEIATTGALTFHGLPTGLAGTVVTFAGSYPLGSDPITS
jgi:hypothetical protein